jgi:zinc transporter ZupT
MKYCQSCGTKAEDKDNFCQSCGSALSGGKKEGSAIGYAILGFLLPIVGIILYAVNTGSSPKQAKAALRGAIAGFIVSAVLSIISTILTSFLGNLFLGSMLFFSL